MISDLAPTDMLFQRIGRLWRHKRDKRVGQPEFDILSGKVQQAGNADELLELLGRANTRIYAPPVLWKTYTVWENRTEVKVPADMRELIEKTYKRDKSQEPFFVQELYEQLEKKKKSLRRKATAVMADVTSIPAMEDDENAATRYSNIVYTYCMVVLEVEKYKKHSILTLLDGKKLRVQRGRSIYETARKIHNNMVPIPSYLFDKRKIETQNSAILRDYIYGKSVLLKKDEIGRLTYENQVTGLCYSDSLGVYEMNLISKGKL
jgi:CRISPR-associated endonuclease/helicase Cas3